MATRKTAKGRMAKAAPQDATLRNVRAARKRHDELKDHVAELADRLMEALDLLRALDGRLTAQQKQLGTFEARFAKLSRTTAAP